MIETTTAAVSQGIILPKPFIPGIIRPHPTPGNRRNDAFRLYELEALDLCHAEFDLGDGRRGASCSGGRPVGRSRGRPGRGEQLRNAQDSNQITFVTPVTGFGALKGDPPAPARVQRFPPGLRVHKPAPAPAMGWGRTGTAQRRSAGPRC